MRGAIPPLTQYVFVAWCLVKHRDNFTFTFHQYKLERYVQNFHALHEMRDWKVAYIQPALSCHLLVCFETNAQIRFSFVLEVYIKSWRLDLILIHVCPT
jgi:hypothetical protein